MIGDQIELVVVGVEGDQVRIGIKAPKEIEVYRKEVYLSIQQANEEAAKSTIDTQAIGELFVNRKHDE